MLGNTCTVGSVKTNSVNLIQESESSVLFGKVANLRDRTNTATHGVDALEGDDLRCLLRVLRQLGFQILQVVVLENDSLCTGVSHTLNHRRMIHRVGEVDTSGQFGAQCSESSIVGNVARREDESSRLSM